MIYAMTPAESWVMCAMILSIIAVIRVGCMPKEVTK